MSKSYKKNPVCKDRNPWAKGQANKKVRKYKDTIANGKQYKKIYSSWNICDWVYYETLPQALEREKDLILWYKNNFPNSKRAYIYNEAKITEKWKQTNYRK